MNIRKIEIFGDIEKFVWIPYVYTSRFKEEISQMYYGYIWSVSINFLWFNLTVLENK